MKRFIILLLIFGLIFAEPFPNNYGTEATLQESEGELGDGYATYGTGDGKITTDITDGYISSCSYWETEWAQYYEGWDMIEIKGHTVFYDCESGFQQGEKEYVYCVMNLCKDDVRYLADCFLIDGTVAEGEEEILAVAYMILGPDEFYKTDLCPIGFVLIGLTLMMLHLNRG